MSEHKLVRCVFFQPQALNYKCRDYETFMHMAVVSVRGRRCDGWGMPSTVAVRWRIGVFPLC